MSVWFPHRVVPLARTVPVRERRGRLAVRYRAGRPADYIFTADIYAYRVHSHPDRHLGWWRFELPEGRGEAELVLDFGRSSTPGGIPISFSSRWAICTSRCATPPGGSGRSSPCC